MNGSSIIRTNVLSLFILSYFYRNVNLFCSSASYFLFYYIEPFFPCLWLLGPLTGGIRQPVHIFYHIFVGNSNKTAIPWIQCQKISLSKLVRIGNILVTDDCNPVLGCGSSRYPQDTGNSSRHLIICSFQHFRCIAVTVGGVTTFAPHAVYICRV